MSSNKQDIEHTFSEAFDQYQHPIDKDAAWAVVASRIEKKKKRRFFWWIWPGGALVIIVMLYSAYSIVDATISNEANTHTEATQLTMSNLSNDLDNNETKSKPDEQPPVGNTIKSTNDGAIRTTMAQGSNSLGSVVSSSKKSGNLAQDKTSSRKLITTNSLEGDENNKYANTKSDDSQNIKKSTRQYVQKALSTSELIKLNSDAEAKFPSSTKVQKLIPIDTHADEKNNSSKQVKSLQISEINAPNNFAKLPILPISLFDILTNKEMASTTELLTFANTEFSQSPFFLEFNLGGFRPYSQFDINQTGEPTKNQQFLNRWNSTYDEIVGYQFGIKFGTKIYKRLDLTVGIQYQRAITKFTYNQLISSTNEIVWNDEAYFFFDEDGRRNNVGGNTIETTNETRRVKAKQLHSFVQIPLQIGYTKLFRRFSLGLHGGPSLNIGHTFNGYVLTGEGEVQQLSKENDHEVYEKTLGLAWAGDLRLGYRLGNKAEAFTSLSYQYSGNNMMKSDFPIRMNMHQLGIIVGVRRNF